MGWILYDSVLSGIMIVFIMVLMNYWMWVVDKNILKL